MGTTLGRCENHLDTAVNELFGADAQIQAVGIARHEDGFGFKAIKNAAKIVPLTGASRARRIPKSVKTIPVSVDTVASDIIPHIRVPHPLAASFIPERQKTPLPLMCGLQVQNIDDDNRQRKAGNLASNLIIIGTLGGFVSLANGKTAILSNNHVLAGENRGLKGKDRILHPGSLSFSAADQVATLTDLVLLQPSPGNARPAMGNVVFNHVDSAVATLESGITFQQRFLPVRAVPRPSGIAQAAVGDKVFKVGRTTGLTFGTITAVSSVVGPVPYEPGPCWFSQQIEIVGDNGTLFSDHGDSGSLIVLTSGEVIGLLYAGNGTQTFACPIQRVLTELNCTLA